LLIPNRAILLLKMGSCKTVAIFFSQRHSEIRACNLHKSAILFCANQREIICFIVLCFFRTKIRIRQLTCAKVLREIKFVQIRGSFLCQSLGNNYFKECSAILFPSVSTICAIKQLPPIDVFGKRILPPAPTTFASGISRTSFCYN